MAARRLRWAVNSSSWLPTEQVKTQILIIFFAANVTQEWMSGLSMLQPEERTRVGQFVYQRDAKFALVVAVHRTGYRLLVLLC
jgi:hypothetical protein